MRTYGDIALREQGWIMGNLEPHVAIRLKHLFPRLPKTSTGPFGFPNDHLHCADLDWFMSRYALRISDEDRAVMVNGRRGYEQTQAEMEAIKNPDYQPPAYIGLRDGQIVRPYQAQAIELGYRSRGLLIGDDLGLGKTYMTAGLFLKSGTLPAAVVVQTHLQRQWAQKITEYTTLRVYIVKKARPHDLPPADVYIFRYSQLRGWVDIFATRYFKSVAYDECQELRTGRASEKGQAAKVLSDSCEYKLGLSATPIYNYGAEIWNILQAINSDVLGPWLDFNREWISEDRKVRDPVALGSYLREQNVFIRRTKRDVGQMVPPINRIIETVESDEKALADIHELARALAKRTVSGAFTDRGQAARELDLLVRHATGVGKARHVAAYVRVLLESGYPIVLAGWHRDVYDIWLRDLADFNPVMYTGSESPNQKDQAVKKFTSGETKLFIISLRSGAGLDGLQHVCSTVVFGELDWSGKIHEQIIGRLDREGQTEQVTAIYLNAEDGSDPPMIDLIGVKSSQAQGIVNLGAFETVESDDSRVKALARQFLKRDEQAEAEKAGPAPLFADLFEAA